MYHRKLKTEQRSEWLNAHGWYVEKIATHFNWTPQTVREVLHKWQKLGLESLWELPGRGGKPKCKESDIVFFGRMPEKGTTYIQQCSISSKIRKRCGLDLTYAVIDGVQARGERGNYSTQRIKFNSNRIG
ncbi:MAG: helix-turn-helix domain-containing protein [Cyanomargarita calcarea GSE-NOS-MK-12-04C]|jgi:transposase|uniref:Helix-turn-helix domain-containing protein n=1 Tax=Cyanomargarita calcarea GSE-NOS-MK-12-04C TaxID=2839659 RepID=A0A951QRV9_9CYAN|nr:helix-turn-helix domain-containing protein [Cyanomargarita calcarea GSE-NOS-MK-12-04C]